MDRGRRRLLIAGLLVLLAVTTGCSRPAPETEVVCDECVDAVSVVAERTNRSVAIGDSATHLYLNGSGDPRIEGRVALSGPGAADFRTNETLLGLVTAELMNADEAVYEDGYSRPAFDRRGVDVAVEGHTLVVGYRVDAAPERRVGGTVLFDHFYRQNGEGRSDELAFDEPFGIETDRLVVHGPGGTEPLVVPSGATASEGRVVWTDDRISTRTYLVFASPGTPGALAPVVTAVDVLTWAAPPAGWGAAFAWLALVPALAVCLRYTGRVERDGDWSPRNDTLCKLVVLSPVAFGVAIGGVVLIGAWLPSVAVLVAAVAAVVYASQRTPSIDTGRADPGVADGAPAEEAGPTERSASSADRDPDRPRLYYEDTATTVQRVTPDVVATRRARRRTVAIVEVLAVAVLATVAVAADFRARYAGTVERTAWLLSLAAFPVVGYAVVDRERVSIRWGAVVAVLGGAWIAAFARVVDVGAHDGSGTWLVFLWAIAVSYVGVLLFYATLWASTR